MRTFEYKIKDESGIHARPAGLLAKLAGDFESEITISHGEKSAEIRRLIAVMGMGIRCDDTVTVTVSGPDEQNAAEAVEKFFRENL